MANGRQCTARLFLFVPHEPSAQYNVWIERCRYFNSGPPSPFCVICENAMTFFRGAIYASARVSGSAYPEHEFLFLFALHSYSKAIKIHCSNYYCARVECTPFAICSGIVLVRLIDSIARCIFVRRQKTSNRFWMAQFPISPHPHSALHSDRNDPHCCWNVSCRH